jgi:FecR-like protein
MNPEEIRPEETRMPAALEQAISEIRGETIPEAELAAAASRVWQRLAAQAEPPAEHIRDCAGFQNLFADYRAGRLTEARALLVRDHLHECVACRRVFERKVVPLPNEVGQALPPANATVGPGVKRWAIAAGVVAASGLVAWFTIFQHAPSGRAIVQSINGTLYEVSAAGLRPMAPGEGLPDGVRIRTARDSRAAIALGDGSLAELRERSDFSTSAASSGPGGDITLHLDRGSLIVQAAKRRSGHLFVATADCRVAVTGTMFGVNTGVKGTRVSVVEGQVSVSQENRQNILRRGDQFSTSEILEPAPVRQEVAWSRNARLLGALGALRESLAQVRLKQVRYSSRLLPLLPASTVFYAAIPNLSDYLAEAKAVFRQKSAEDAGLRAWLAGPEGAQAATVEAFLDKLRAANEYLGDEIVVFGTTSAPAPVILAEVKRDGFAEFLRGAGLPLAMEIHSGMVLLSPNPKALAVPLDATFQKTAFYQRIDRAYRQGAGLLLCADLQHMPHPPMPPLPHGRSSEVPPARYLIVEQQQVSKRMETRADLDFEGSRQGIASWLAPPSPFGALDYITPEATLAAAFVVADPAAMLDQILSHDAQGAEGRQELAASLGGEFALALDGPPFPVPSWKLVAEVYDPARFQKALEKLVAEHNRAAEATGAKRLRMAQETADGRTYYLLGVGDPNPLGEAHYTFASGYLIAAPTRALVARALETAANGTGLARSQSFTAMLPHDPYADFSAVVYQNLGTTLAPFAGLFGPQGTRLANPKPLLVAAYAEPDRVTLASTGDLLGISLNNLLSGSALSAARDMLPMAQLLGTSRAPIPSR